MFISSRNTYNLGSEELSAVRKRLVKEIEKRFPFLDVRINEAWPASSTDPREESESAGRECDVFVGILVNDGGFTDVNGLTATHQEFAEAANHTRSKMLVFVESTLKKNVTREELKKDNCEYAALVEEWMGFRSGKVVGFFANATQLEAAVVKGLEAHSAMTVGWHAQRYREKVQSEIEAEWELMTFTERHGSIKAALRSQAEKGRISVSGSQDTMKLGATGDSADDPGTPDHYLLNFEDRGLDLPVIVTVCPDRFSYADAARYVGYPFRSAVETWDNELGPLHFVVAYRTVTDTQVRRHIGNPDIHVSHQDWGFFASDPERFIQIAYLTKCNDPHEVGQHVRDFLIWLDSYGDETATLLDRARIRGQILRARRS